MHNGLLSSGPDPFGQNLTQSARNGAGVAQRCPGRLWKYGTESESRKLSAGSGPVASCQKPGQPDESRAALTPAYFQTDAFGQILTRTSGQIGSGWVSFAQCDPCLRWKNGAETDAEVGFRHIQAYGLSGPILAACWP